MWTYVAMGPRCTWLFFIFLICVILRTVDSTKGFSRCRGYWSGLLPICCVCIYVRLVMLSYLLFYCIYVDAWCITCCPKREETLEVYTVIAYICYIYFDAWCITCCWVISVYLLSSNRSFYPTTTAVPSVSFLILHPRDRNSVVTVRQRKTKRRWRIKLWRQIKC